MRAKLFVGNLSWNVDDAQLEELFREYGDVESARVITDRDSGRSRGFGFVEMATDEEAQRAIEQLHDRSFGGRNLTVNEAKPMPARSGGGGGGYGGGGGRREPRW